jgi:Xaa-Pro aminopeptidase
VDHAARRRRLLDRFAGLDIDAFLVTRQVNARYLTGFSGSNGQLLLFPDRAVLFTDSRYEEQSAREAPDVEREIYSKAFHERVARVAAATKVERLGFETAGLTHQTYRRLEEALEPELVPTEDEVERLRWSKDHEELGLLRRAQDITDDAFERLVPKLVEGITERQVAVELEVAMRELGAERVGFDTIAAFGENAAEPHHRPTERPLRPGDVVKLDFGSFVDGYHSDMTRTVAFGDPPGELREVYDVVRAAQQAGIDAVRAGIRGGEADSAARRVIEEAGYGPRFGHSLGHGVGLEIHEGPTLRAGSEDELPVGTVVTVEPGIYLPGVGGVRIEDMVEVTEDGCRPMPRTPKDLLVASS